MTKSKRKSRRSKARVDAVGSAQSWLELGIQPVPLKAGSKRPSGGKGWNKLRVDPDSLEQFFEKGENIGGLWGEPSGWIVDVDLDWTEAADFAALYLPETFVYGRRLRPATHYLFKCKGAETQKWAAPKGEIAEGEEISEMIVEIRSTGSQSVLPPSIHPDGDRYEIDIDVPFTAITKSELQKLASHVAAAAILLRNFPSKGSRHDYIHALTGALMWSGWEEDETRRFMLAFLEASDDMDSEPKDRETTVENTIEHFRKGDRIAGWRTLGEWLEPKTIQTLRKWVTPDKKFRAVPKHANGELHNEIPAFDPRLAEVPGLVGDIAKWIGKRAFLQQPAFDLAAAMTCVSLVSYNRYVVDAWDTPLQPYFILLAPTAGGKDSALDSVFEFAVKSKLADCAFQGFQSHHALLDQLAESPGIACWLWDEAARKLRSTRSAGSLDYQIITWILSLYGKANRSVPAFPGRKARIPSLTRPFLSILASAQPGQLLEAASVSDLATGLLNRFILFDSGDAPARPNLHRVDVFPSAIKRAVRELKAYEPKQIPHKIPFESEAVYNRFRDFDAEARAFSAEGDNEIWGRANQNALIISGIVAVGINPKRPMITSEISSWAIALIRWCISCWSVRIGESSARSFREKESKAVERYIRNARRYSTRGSGASRRLLNRGLMPYSVLQRLCRHLQGREFTEIIDQLIEAELIATGEEDGVECYWPTS